MASKTITAFFDSYDDAADVVRRLEAAGVAHRDISIVANNKDDRYTHHTDGRMLDRHDADSDADEGAGTGATVGTIAGGGAGLLAGIGMLALPGLGPVAAAGWLVSTLVGAGAGAAVGGLVGALVDAGVDEKDAHAYAEGVRRGGALVTVRANESEVDRIVDILDDEGTVDFDQRERSWRDEGWLGRSEIAGGGIGAAGSTTTGLDTDATDRLGADRMGRDSMGMGSSGLGSGSTRMGSDSMGLDSSGRSGLDRSRESMGDRDEVIPVAEEELHVGKRDVNRGRVRIHAHVVEEPVNEEVRLREERVSIERRPVEGSKRVGALGDENLFRDRTVEVDEHGEEAVVSKEARVREELVVHKDVNERTETVSDKVRRTEVEVDDDRNQKLPGAGKKGRDRT